MNLKWKCKDNKTCKNFKLKKLKKRKGKIRWQKEEKMMKKRDK